MKNADETFEIVIFDEILRKIEIEEATTVDTLWNTLAIQVDNFVGWQVQHQLEKTI